MNWDFRHYFVSLISSNSKWNIPEWVTDRSVYNIKLLFIMADQLQKSLKSDLLVGLLMKSHIIWVLYKILSYP